MEKLNVILPKNQGHTINTPNHLPKLHQLGVVVGHRGSGKTTAMASMLRHYADEGFLDVLLIVSPTASSNSALLSVLPQPHEIYNPEDKNVVENIQSFVQGLAQEYEAYWQLKEMWDELKTTYRTTGEIPQDKASLFFNEQTQQLEPPSHEFDGKRPVVHVLIDDSQSTPLFRSRKFLNMVIRHRHVGQFELEPGALGLSVWLCVQNFKAVQGGLPRPIRDNASLLMVFRSHNQKMIDEIAESCAGEVDYKSFMQMYRKSTEEPHGFLMVDFISPVKFRKNLDKPLRHGETSA